MRETKYFYYFERANEESGDIKPFFLKDVFLEKFENGQLKAIDGCLDKIEKYECLIEDEEDLSLLMEDREED